MTLRLKTPLVLIAAIVPLLSLPLAAEPAKNNPLVKSEPLRARAAVAGAKHFTRLDDAKVTGIDQVNRVDVDHPESGLYHSGMACGGVAIGDVDGDGKPDIFAANGPQKNKLFRQIGEMKFEDITAKAAPGLDGGSNWASGAALADVNGDGRLDIYVCNFDKSNELWINMGAGKKNEPVVFEEKAREYGLDVVSASHSMYFADYDNDGDLDAFLLTNRYEDPAGFDPKLPTEIVNGQVRVKADKQKYFSLWRIDADNWGTEPTGVDDILFRNDTAGGKTRFTDVTAEAGISGRGDGLSATWFDYDRDGDLDLWIGNDFISEDKFWRNNGDGTFVEGLGELAPATCWFSMGADFGDINNDGWPDFLLGDMSATTQYKAKTTMGVMGGMDLRRANNSKPPQYMRNACFINTGTGRFLEAAYLLGVSSTDWTWAIKFADFDNDGWQDIYINNGIARHMNDSDKVITQDMLLGKHMWDYFKVGPLRKEQHRGYRNTGKLAFDDVSKDWGLDHIGTSYAAAYADLDRDGDIDLVEASLDENLAILRNNSAAGNSIAFRLAGTKSNRQGIGARIEITTAAGSQFRQIIPCTGYHSVNEAIAHFGLGDAKTVKRAVIQWPGGIEQTLDGLDANRLYTITEPATGPKATPPAKPEPLWEPSPMLAQAKHEENVNAGDFKKQPLLPYLLSQTGPGIAWSDVDGDGDDDFFLAKATGQVGEIRYQVAPGRFVARFSDTFRADKAGESIAPVFFDADGDGDIDLFLARGSYEFDTGAPEQQDRLYLNDGKGNFALAERAIPADALPTNTAVACDFDGDGDIDLFAGDRVIPGDYPAPCSGRILRNDTKGTNVVFTDVTKEIAPALHDTGLITSALWTDANGDGNPDLLIAREWGALQLLINHAGKFIERTAKDDMTTHTGQWTSLAAADIDHDGDLDYLAGNTGWNTKFHRPTPDRPRLLFHGEFDGTGKKNILEAWREGDNLYPHRDRITATAAMPFLKTKVPTFHAYATATLEEIYGRDKLTAARRLEAATHDTGIFINQGTKGGEPTFKFTPLDPLAQIAPVHGCVFTDADGDGHIDAYLAQNLATTDPFTARFNGGLSQLLLGDGKGAFTPARHDRTGLIEPGDARGLATCDLNGDDRPDFSLAVNNVGLHAFTSTPVAPTPGLRIRLPAARAPGARVTVEIASLPPQTQEYSAGGGYASQSAPVLFFGLGTARATGTVKIRWADGKTTEQKITAPGLTIIK